MAEALSVTASIIAITNLAFASCKGLCEFISTIRDAPQTFQDLNYNIRALSQILETLRTSLDQHCTSLSRSQIACLQEARPTLEGCDLACKAFKTKMEALTTHSQDGRSLRDSIKLSFQAKSVADFQMRVVSWKGSLSLVLEVAILMSMSANTEAFRALETKMATAQAQITADLNVVNTRLEKLLAFEPESEEDMQILSRKTGFEEEQKTTLMQCLSLCQVIADEATGHSFKENEVLGEARAIYGNVGNVSAGSASHSYDSNSANDNARVVMGNMDGASFLEFMK